MTGYFCKIAITLPDKYQDEARKIMFLLDHGFDRVHIRKPEWSEREVKELLDSIDNIYYSRLSLHQTPGLIGIGEGLFPTGFHINRRFSVAPPESVIVSKSCHSLSEIEESAKDTSISYMMLSPIYDSISKKGYFSRFSPKDLEGLPKHTIALGGVTPERFEELQNMGFSGAAMLGYVWDLNGSYMKDFHTKTNE